jgi:thiamine phosphate synthase YjbQ (UPF0047 family)
MTVESNSVNLHTHHEGQILDITEKVQDIVAKGRIMNGVAFLFIPGSTAALTTLEYEPGLLMIFLACSKGWRRKTESMSMKSSGGMETATLMLELH